MALLNSPNSRPCTRSSKRLEGRQTLNSYGHSITRGARVIKVIPGQPQVSWVPTLAKPADGSTFSAQCLGQWQRSHEVVAEKRVECQGVLRLAFELFGLDQERVLAPSPRADANQLVPFTAN